jgi:hypothetical protein
MPGNNSDLSQTWAIEPRCRLPGQRVILGQRLRGGGPGRPFCARRFKELRKGLGPVTLENKNTTHTGVAAVRGDAYSAGL